ncbi:MAG: hypothetical protein BRD35_08275 [Bacteroidetes bacterium QH_7_62_13]|nr:MAG: hypothetical protein BRD35_08275 [Bacteroidetes bacterium QH_7_62_13]
MDCFSADCFSTDRFLVDVVFPDCLYFVLADFVSPDCVFSPVTSPVALRGPERAFPVFPAPFFLLPAPFFPSFAFVFPAFDFDFFDDSPPLPAGFFPFFLVDFSPPFLSPFPSVLFFAPFFPSAFFVVPSPFFFAPNFSFPADGLADCFDVFLLFFAPSFPSAFFPFPFVFLPPFFSPSDEDFLSPFASFPSFLPSPFDASPVPFFFDVFSPSPLFLDSASAPFLESDDFSLAASPSLDDAFFRGAFSSSPDALSRDASRAPSFRDVDASALSPPPDEASFAAEADSALPADRLD